MTIRWRLCTAFVQLLIISLITNIVTGSFVSPQTWFLSGLLAIVINPQLLEPFYPRPIDVLVNCFFCFFLYYYSPHTVALTGWNAFLSFCVLSFLVALLAILLGREHDLSSKNSIARTSATLSRYVTSSFLYSAVFWLSLIEYRPHFDSDFWTLAGSWVLLMIVGKVNWQAIWSTASGRPFPCKVEGMIGPSVLLISSPEIPSPGKIVNLVARDMSSEGIVLSRIRRSTDVWGQIHVNNHATAERFVKQGVVSIDILPDSKSRLVGSVAERSSQKSLSFIATQDHEIGDVVAVPYKDFEVLYQVSSAQVINSNIKGGAHLLTEAIASQLGVFDPTTFRIRKHRWVPTPGAPVLVASKVLLPDTATPPNNSLLLGNLIGTNVPVYLDLPMLCEGHLAILGMTRMGKTSLAIKLARALSVAARVTVVDQTGEYVSKKGLPVFNPKDDGLPTALSVFEPVMGSVAPDQALKFLEDQLKIASTEYKVGKPRRRILIIDEAHQFIPEPSGLGFQAPGRDSAYKFGLLMMQVRKFGMAIILISQRTAVVAKSALSQCENLIAFKSVDQTGLDYLESILGSNTRDMLPQLNQGEAMVVGPSILSDNAVGISVAQ